MFAFFKQFIMTYEARCVGFYVLYSHLCCKSFIRINVIIKDRWKKCWKWGTDFCTLRYITSQRLVLDIWFVIDLWFILLSMICPWPMIFPITCAWYSVISASLKMSASCIEYCFNEETCISLCICVKLCIVLLARWVL